MLRTDKWMSSLCWGLGSAPCCLLCSSSRAWLLLRGWINAGKTSLMTLRAYRSFLIAFNRSQWWLLSYGDLQWRHLHFTFLLKRVSQAEIRGMDATTDEMHLSHTRKLLAPEVPGPCETCSWATIAAVGLDTSGDILVRLSFPSDLKEIAACPGHRC